MQKKEFHIICSDGHRMPVYAWLPDSEPLMVLHIAHGMSEYAERYAPVAAMLVGQGIAVYAHDHRAHGRAVPSNKELGIAVHGWFYQQIEDMLLLIQDIKGLHTGKKVVMLGHSMGSFIAQRFFQLHGKILDGLVLSATNGTPDPLLPFGIGVAWLQMKIFGKNHRSKLIDLLSFQKFNKAFAPNRTDHDWLSRDEKQVDLYVADAWCGFVCNDIFFYYFFKGISDAFKEDHISQVPKNIPVYAFAGGKDPVGLAGKGFLDLIKKWEKAGVTDLEYKLYQDGRHESLNEINRQEVVGDLVGWLKKYFKF